MNYGHLVVNETQTHLMS